MTVYSGRGATTPSEHKLLTLLADYKRKLNFRFVTDRRKRGITSNALFYLNLANVTRKLLYVRLILDVDTLTVFSFSFSPIAKFYVFDYGRR